MRYSTAGALARTIRHAAVFVWLVLMFGAGCRTREKPKGRFDGIDGGFTPRSECNVPSMNCYNGCFRRNEGPICTGCCYDQRFLCDTQQPHSFESCDGTQ